MGPGAVDRPDAAYAHGAALAARLLDGNPRVHVRQVHCPASRGAAAGAAVTFAVRWRTLPAAYARFLADRLEPAAPVLLLHDARTWPVRDCGDGHSFQAGCPAGGLDPVDFHPDARALGQVLRAAGGEETRWLAPEVTVAGAFAEHGVESGFEHDARSWGDRHGHPLHRVVVPQPDALSAVTADLYRGWLRRAGKTGNRLVVECGRLLDPGQVLRAGLVPYWCENATARRIAGVEWWLAGSEPFSSVDVLPEPPGLRSPAYAGLPQWLAVAGFGAAGGPWTGAPPAATRSPRYPPDVPRRCCATSPATCPRRRRCGWPRLSPRYVTRARTRVCWSADRRRDRLPANLAKLPRDPAVRD